jgi:hypothetical protein
MKDVADTLDKAEKEAAAAPANNPKPRKRKK